MFNLRKRRGETLHANESEMGVMQENDIRIQEYVREM